MEKASSNWELENISKCRGVLFGISTLLIVFFHSRVNFVSLSSYGPLGNLGYYVFTGLRKLGEVGVDIFAIMSGLGLYYSYSKDQNLKLFYKKRAMRILPPFFVVILIWAAIRGPFNFSEYLRYVFQIEFLKGTDLQTWFIPYLLFCYLVFPLIYKGIEKWRWIGTCIGIAAMLLIHFVVPLPGIATSRLPAFVVGVQLGKMVFEKKSVSRKWIWISAIVFAGFLTLFLYDQQFTDGNLLSAFSLKRLLFCPFSISIIILMSALKKKLDLGILYRFLTWVGGYSLEVYLLFEKVQDKMNGIFNGIGGCGLTYVIPCFVTTMVLAILLKLICNDISKKLSN